MTLYNRFDPDKGYERHLFQPDRYLQSAELNELQSASHHRLKSIADVLFKEGAIIRGCACTVDADTGAARLDGGALYLAGAVRGVTPAALQVPTTGAAYIGVYLLTSTVTADLDPALRNPAVGTASYQRDGADREHIAIAWGVGGSGQPGDFYPVWEVVDGHVNAREAAPELAAISSAIARYDRDSSGGTYIVRGMRVTMLPDEGVKQVYVIDRGAARVGGGAIEQNSARRVVIDTLPDLATVDSEPHASTTDGLQHIAFDRWPVFGIPQVRIQSRKTVDVVHGGFTGVADPLPDAGVIIIESVKQGATTYAAPADYVFAAGQIDWSPAGAEPAPGSSYQVTYQHIHTVAPINLTPTGLDVTGALAGTLVLLTYQHAMRRIDRLVLGADGRVSAVKGVPDAWNPATPQVPADALPLASVYQTWDDRRRLIEDSVRLVPMQTLNDYDRRLDDVRTDLAEIRLAVDVSGRHAGVRKGLFADPMLDNSMRDAGVPQTATIGDGWLQLPSAIDCTNVNPAQAGRLWVDHTNAIYLRQPLATGSLRVNPTNTPSTKPNTLVLTPPVDRWVQPVTTPVGHWHQWVLRGGSQDYVYSDDVRRTLIKQAVEFGVLPDVPRYARPVIVRFDVTGLNPAEAVQSVRVGGLAATLGALPGHTLTANAAGEVSGTFVVPDGLMVGTHAVQIVGAHGSTVLGSYAAEYLLSFNVTHRYVSDVYREDIRGYVGMDQDVVIEVSL